MEFVPLSCNYITVPRCFASIFLKYIKYLCTHTWAATKCAPPADPSSEGSLLRAGEIYDLSVLTKLFQKLLSTGKIFAVKGGKGVVENDEGVLVAVERSFTFHFRAKISTMSGKYREIPMSSTSHLASLII